MQEMQKGDLKEMYIPRLLEGYRKDIVPKMKDKFGYKNNFAVPRLLKIVVNMGIGEATSDAKLVEKCARDLGLITGQKPKITRARKPISNFKIRKGMAIGCCVTLRRYRMYEFLDRLISIVIPRIRDFRGISVKSFDGRGNYTFGIKEQTVFPEIEYDKIDAVRGMDISIVTTAKTDEEGRELLMALGMPFRKN